jgi:hypothetical protein
MNPEIIRSIQLFSFIVFDEHRDFAGRRDLPQLIVEVGACIEVARFIEVESIGTAGILLEHR